MTSGQAKKLVECVLNSLKKIEELSGVKTKPRIIFQYTKHPGPEFAEDPDALRVAASLREYGGLHIDSSENLARVNLERHLVVNAFAPKANKEEFYSELLYVLPRLVIKGHPLDWDCVSENYKRFVSGENLSKKALKQLGREADSKMFFGFYQLIPGNAPISQITSKEFKNKILGDCKKDNIMQEYISFVNTKGALAGGFIDDFLGKYIETILSMSECKNIFDQMRQHETEAIRKLILQKYVKSLNDIVKEEISQSGKAMKYSMELGELAGFLREPKELKKILAIEPINFASYANRLYQEALKKSQNTT